MCRLLAVYYSNVLIQFSTSYSYQIFLNVILKADFLDMSCGRKIKMEIMTTRNLEDDLGPDFSSYNIWVKRSRASPVSEWFHVEIHI